MKKSTKIQACLKPMPNTLVSCRGKNGENNALVVAYCFNCSYDPPMVMVGIVPTRYSYKLIKDSGCFVVNLPEKSQKEMFDYLGSHSGADENKLEKIGAVLSEAEKVNAPILSECPVSIECSIVDSIMTGSHEMFVGKIECIHADQEYVKEDGSIDFSKIDLL
jgi:flavin reductase (DIM6/NTAB) family NADH-FMN oxidoreductase RutF